MVDQFVAALKMHSVKAKGTVCLLYLKYLFTLVALESLNVDYLGWGGIELCSCVRERERYLGHTFLTLGFIL